MEWRKENKTLEVFRDSEEVLNEFFELISQRTEEKINGEMEFE